jgi:hypothetical protein
LLLLLSYGTIHGSDKGVLFVSIGSSKNLTSFKEELGLDVYINDFFSINDVFSINGSFMLLGSEYEKDTVYGYRLGARVEAPTRISPFWGLGTFFGSSDFWGDKSTNKAIIPTTYMATVFSEAGLHIWTTKDTRLSLYYSYNFSSNGRRDDMKILGLSFGYMVK